MHHSNGRRAETQRQARIVAAESDRNPVSKLSRIKSRSQRSVQQYKIELAGHRDAETRQRTSFEACQLLQIRNRQTEIGTDM